MYFAQEKWLLYPWLMCVVILRGELQRQPGGGEVEMARGQRGGERGGGFRGGRGGYGGGVGFHRGGGRGRGGYIQRLTRELYEEQDLNSSRLAEIERLSSTVDTQRDELAEAREELQQERNQREGAVERENYWEAEFQHQIKNN